MSFNASGKQITYALSLLREVGFDDTWMNARFRELGATMRERQGRVHDWVAGMTKGRCSELIRQLLAMKAKGVNRKMEQGQLFHDHENSHTSEKR